MGQLDGQVAIVTGGGTGIGRATALALSAEGCRVALVGRRPEPLQETVDELTAAGRTALALPADVADRSAGPAAVARVVQEWGRLDLLVNNAGLNVPRRDVSSVTADEWTEVLDVNLTGTFLFTQAALPQMRAQGAGTVINVSSMAGHRASALTGPAYSAAKAGVISFTDSLNLTERAHGIRACAVCPGEVATPILDKRPQPPSAQARAAMLQPEDLAQTFLLVATLPQRATIELLTIYPTVQRDWSAEVPS
jgi:NAD(P)-dependent dehydrogenase (short-subunit alcohol dehydrogenase family)